VQVLIDGDDVDLSDLIEASGGRADKILDTAAGNQLLRKRTEQAGLVGMSEMFVVKKLSYTSAISAIAQGLVPAPRLNVGGCLFWDRSDAEQYKNR